MDSTLTQIIVGVGSILAGMFALIKYWLRESTNTREKELEDRRKEREEIFKLFKEMQFQMIDTFQKFQMQYLETYNQKNGQIERIFYVICHRDRIHP
jgi:hypothetical protein